MTTVLRRHRIAAGIGMVLWAASAQAADDTDTATMDNTQLSPIQVTANRTEQATAEIPQSVSVVDADTVARMTPQTLGDLLRGQPGAFTQSSGPGQGIVIVRGLKGSEVLHLVDGMRLNMAFFRNSPSQYVALIDPYNIAGVELLRGPGATLYGSDAMGGVLQVFTPATRFQGDALQFSGGARAQFGSADLSKISRVDAAMGAETWSLAGGFTYMEYGEREVANGGRQAYSDYHARGGDLKWLFEPLPGHELMLSASSFETPDMPRYFSTVGGPGGEGSGLPETFEPNNRHFLHARYRIGVPAGFIDRTEIHLAQQIINDDRTRLVSETTEERQENRSTLTGFTLQFASQVHNTGLRYGLDAYLDEVDSSKYRTNLETQAVSTRAPTFPDGAESRSFGVYLDTATALTSRLNLSSGLRYSYEETRLTETPLSPAADVSNGDLTAHLAATFALTPTLRWTASAARGFRAPNVFDLGTLGPRPNTDPPVINVPNPELEKETIVSVDTGFKWHTERFGWDLVVFKSWHDDRIEPREPTGNTIAEGDYGCDEPTGCVEVRSENVAKATFWGIESGFNIAITPQWQGYATLNYTYGEEEKDGQTGPANRIPPLNGRLGLAWSPDSLWRAESYVLFADRQDRLDDDDQTDTRIDPDGTAGWVTVNLRLGWSPTSAWRLQLDGLNLLDQAYREHGSGIDGAGIGVVGTAAWRF